MDGDLGSAVPLSAASARIYCVDERYDYMFRYKFELRVWHRYSRGYFKANP